MHSLENWIEAMQGSEMGKSTLVNMLYDIQQNHLSEDVLRNFFQDLNELWSINQNETHITVGINEKILSRLFDNVKSNYFCKGKVIEEDSISCSRTMNALSFIEHNWNKRKSPFDITGQPFSEREVKKLENSDLAKIGKGEMRTNYNFTWVTKSSSIDEIRNLSSKENLATDIRNKLGLYHERKECMLIEIIYPVDELIERKMTKPTFLEGCFSDIYCSASMGDWGGTIDLNTYEKSLPEAIHCSVSFGEGFSLRYLGMANSLESSSKPFSQELSQNWTTDSKNELRSHINKLLK